MPLGDTTISQNGLVQNGVLRAGKSHGLVWSGPLRPGEMMVLKWWDQNRRCVKWSGPKWSDRMKKMLSPAAGLAAPTPPSSPRPAVTCQSRGAHRFFGVIECTSACAGECTISFLLNAEHRVCACPPTHLDQQKPVCCTLSEIFI